MEPHAHEDTALSVSYIRDLGDHTKAALASELAAETYGMEILEEHVQDNEVNMTRFFCMTSHEVYPENADKVSIRMVTEHKPGSLYNALGIYLPLITAKVPFVPQDNIFAHRSAILLCYLFIL